MHITHSLMTLSVCYKPELLNESPSNSYPWFIKATDLPTQLVHDWSAAHGLRRRTVFEGLEAERLLSALV